VSLAVVGNLRGDAVQKETVDWATVSGFRLLSSAAVRSTTLRRLVTAGAAAIRLKSGCHFTTLPSSLFQSSTRKAWSRRVDSLSVADAIVTSSPEVTSVTWRRSTTTEHRRLTTRRRALVLDTWCDIDTFTCWSRWRRRRHRRWQLTAVVTLSSYRYPAAADCLMNQLHRRPSNSSLNLDCSDREACDVWTLPVSASQLLEVEGGSVLQTVLPSAVRTERCSLSAVTAVNWRLWRYLAGAWGPPTKYSLTFLRRWRRRWQVQSASSCEVIPDVPCCCLYVNKSDF